MKASMEFAERANKKHNNKYDYSKSIYRNSKSKVVIICSEHGEFEQTPNAHLRGQGCRQCYLSSLKTNTLKFIAKANQKHGGSRYDYSFVEYIDAFTPVIIVCPEHGQFKQSPKHHLCGRSCPQCAVLNSANATIENARKRFAEGANKKHNNKYDYSKSIYKNSKSKVVIICPEHGEFEQTPNAHLRGQGCRQCGIERNKEFHFIGIDEFIKRSNDVHGHKYSYDLCNIAKLHDLATIVCPKHGKFEQLAYNHLNGHGCPRCPVIISKPQQEIFNFVSMHCDNVELNNRTLISPLEIDIVAGHVGIEFHGLYYHSFCAKESQAEIKRHQHKYVESSQRGIVLMQIFEDEWMNKKDLIKSMLLSKFGMLSKIHARQCTIVTLDSGEYNNFCVNNHVYGAKNARYRYGLLFDDEIVFVMSFNKKSDRYEIERLCSKMGHIVVGGASRLFKRFIRDHNPNKIISYCDLRYGSGAVYECLGMGIKGITRPNYFYVKHGNRFSRIMFQKHKLKNKLKSFDPSLTEAENMFNNGYRRIWDAGHKKFEWLNNDCK